MTNYWSHALLRLVAATANMINSWPLQSISKYLIFYIFCFFSSSFDLQLVPCSSETGGWRCIGGIFYNASWSRRTCFLFSYFYRRTFFIFSHLYRRKCFIFSYLYWRPRFIFSYLYNRGKHAPYFHIYIILADNDMPYIFIFHIDISTLTSCFLIFVTCFGYCYICVLCMYLQHLPRWVRKVFCQIC